jgi:DNA-binding CsgD family transcriptional regulator
MLENLSPREREIFDLLLNGVSPKEIARKLNISLHTVAYHRTNLYNKLGVQNIQELFAQYSTNGKEPPPEALETEAAAPVSTGKKKKLKVLLPVGIALFAFSVLLLWIINPGGKPSAHTAPKGEIIPVNNLGFYSTSDAADGGNSTSIVFITREKIDGVSVDVLNIKINLVKREDRDHIFANVYTRTPNIIQRLRQANGIRFKARGDEKLWTLDFFTAGSTAENNYAHYSYFFNTVKDQIIVVDVPYSSLFLPDYFEQYSFDFNKETITGFAITANNLHGYSSSLLQIFDFEIY